MIGVLVSRRPHLIDRAVASALEFCDRVVVKVDTGDFVSALTEAFDVGEPAIKIDDDDWYPSHHARRMMAHYAPGAIVWNSLDVFGCDGQSLGRQRHLSGAVIPPGVRWRADETGRVQDNLGGYVHRVAYTGSRKRQCPADWSWGDWPRMLDRIRCVH